MAAHTGECRAQLAAGKFTAGTLQACVQALLQFASQAGQRPVAPSEQPTETVLLSMGSCKPTVREAVAQRKPVLATTSDWVN